LKRTGLGVSLDSDKPHLVGIDEDVLATGITLYHLRDGDTRIGKKETQLTILLLYYERPCSIIVLVNRSFFQLTLLPGTCESSPDIVLKGSSAEVDHCRIHLDKDGVATLYPSENALCMVNAALIDEPTRLGQGCVIVLGKTNMFRFNDPKEAQNMRLMQQSCTEKGAISNVLDDTNRSLLSQSLSDLRNTPTRKVSLPPTKLHFSEGDIQAGENEAVSDVGQSLVEVTERSGDSDDPSTEVLTEREAVSDVEEEEEEEEDVNMMSSTTTSEFSCSKEGEPPKIVPTARTNQLYQAICDQKNVIVACLESETCDLDTLNREITVLQDLQVN